MKNAVTTSSMWGYFLESGEGFGGVTNHFFKSTKQTSDMRGYVLYQRPLTAVGRMDWRESDTRHSCRNNCPGLAPCPGWTCQPQGGVCLCTLLSRAHGSIQGRLWVLAPCASSQKPWSTFLQAVCSRALVRPAVQ